MTIEEVRQTLALDKLQETGIGLVSPRTYQAIGAALIPQQREFDDDFKKFFIGGEIAVAGIRLIQNPFIPDGEIWPFEKWDFGRNPKTQFELNSDRDKEAWIENCRAEGEVYLQTSPKYVHLSEIGTIPVITAKDITVVVPAVFENLDPIWMMTASAAQFGIPLSPYGMGGVYNGWTDIKIYKLRDLAANCPTSHIMYTDARDAWFLAGLEEVADKYNAMGCPPILLSAQCDIFGTYIDWYQGLPWDMSKVFRYVGTPGQLCEAKALADALTWLQNRYHLGHDYGSGGLPDDDPPWWCEFMRGNPGAVTFDTECAIFMNAGSRPAEGEMFGDVLEIRPPRLYNKITGQWPCLFHFNGGYSHAMYGKWEQLEPFWKAFGFTQRPPWEKR